MACAVEFTGTRENIARAVEYIKQIDATLSTESIDTAMPEETFSTTESYHECRQNFHVLLVRTDVVRFGQLQITKQTCVESCSWSRCQANLFILERSGHKDVEADVKFVPVEDKPGQGERFVTKDHGGIIEADIPIPNFGIDKHTACEKVELMTRKAIGKASSGKTKSIAFLVLPVEHWKMDDLMACIAKGCVDWLLHSTDEYPRSVLLCTEDQDNFRTTDGYIDKCIKTKMRDTSTGHLEPKLKVIPGHLDKIEADVIVNTTDTRLDLSNGKLSDALLRAAGQNLQQECIKRYPNGIRRGEVAVTQGYNLSCWEVFHIALGTQSKPEEFMQSVRNAMRLCLKKASEHKFRSIAFPAIGTGSLQYPTDLVASEMVMSIERFIQEVSSTTLQDILFVIHPKSKEVLEVFEKMGRKLWKPNSSATQGNVDVSTRFEITGTKEDVKQCKKMSSSTQVEKTHRLHGQMAESHGGLSSHAQFSWSTHTANSRLYKCGNVVIRVYKADICNVPVECIVNAANGDLQHDGGIAYVIAQAGGEQLRKECRNIINEKGSVPVTNVVKTSAGNLPYKYVLHAVGPCFYNYKPVTVSSLKAYGQDLKQTILTCLNMCAKLNIETVAIPTISSGIFGIPRDVCAVKYAEALVEFCTSNHTIKEIHFVDTLDDMVDIMHKTFNAMITQRKPPPFDMNVYVERTTTVATGGNTGVNRTTTVATGGNTGVNRTTTVATGGNTGVNRTTTVATGVNMGLNRTTTVATGGNTGVNRTTTLVTDGNTGVNRTSMIENTERKPKQPNFDNDMDESIYEHKRIKNTARDRPKSSSKKAQTKKDVSCSFISGNKQTQCSFVNREGLEVEVLIYEGNIVRLTGPEAVVCSDNSTGDGRGKVANLLLNEGGQTYKKLKTLQFNSPRNHGEVITTPGGGNKYTWVMHGIVSRKDPNGIPILFKNILKETKTRELSSLALPLLGTGVGTLDPRSSAEMLFYELINFCNTNGTAAFTLHVVLNEKVVADTAKDVFKRNIDAIMKKQESPVLESDLKLQEGTSRTDKNVSSQQRETHSEIEDCVICMDRVTDAKKLNCGHVFCTDCIEGYFRVKQVCPTCGKVCGIVTGDQPDGSMEIVKRVSPIAGYEQYKSITITYSFGNGIQGDNHPRPGSPFKGISRTAYLPDSIDGREVCAMLKVAFQRRLVFTIGTSRTTGKEGVITWNDIHHKTDMRPHAQFGYPDTTYLQRVREELRAKGVTVQDIEKAFLKELKRDKFRLTVTAD